MGAQLRIYRRRIRSIQSTKKITRAMELIAASRIVKAQQRVAAAKPYAEEITRVLSTLASRSSLDHPLLNEQENVERAAVIVVTSDRGLAGAYNANVLREAAELMALLKSESKERVLYVIGRKGVGYYRFRGRAVAGDWTGFSEQPRFVNAREVGNTVIAAFRQGGLDAEAGVDDDRVVAGVQEIHLVYTEFVSALTQKAVAIRVAPLVVEEVEVDEAPTGYLPEYEFEPEPEELLDALLPKYINTRIFAALLESAASESAARRRAMKAATDNAEDLIKSLTRAANSARQAEITQEISEIVGGADALAAAGSDVR